METQVQEVETRSGDACCMIGKVTLIEDDRGLYFSGYVVAEDGDHKVIGIRYRDEDWTLAFSIALPPSVADAWEVVLVQTEVFKVAQRYQFNKCIA